MFIMFILSSVGGDNANVGLNVDAGPPAALSAPQVPSHQELPCEGGHWQRSL